MSMRIGTINDFQQYLTGVMARAEHHARNLEPLLPTLAGAVLFFKDPATNIEARTYRGTTANVIFVMIGGRRFALKYDHDSRSIQVRHGTTRGPLEGTFDDNSSPKSILATFRTLTRTGKPRALAPSPSISAP